MRKALVVVAMGAALAGCSSKGPSDGQILGAGGGAALGAGIGRVVGHYTTQGTLIGLAVGAVVGYAAGTAMDPPAEEKHANATISVAENGQPVSWSTEKGNHGSVSPAGAEYTDRSGRPCRPLKQDVSMNGEDVARQVTACKAADGTWVVGEYQPEKAD
jgi:surface antigen